MIFVMLIHWIEIRNVNGLAVFLRSTPEKFKSECGSEMKGVKSRIVNIIIKGRFLRPTFFASL